MNRTITFTYKLEEGVQGKGSYYSAFVTRATGGAELPVVVEALKSFLISIGYDQLQVSKISCPDDEQSFQYELFPLADEM